MCMFWTYPCMHLRECWWELFEITIGVYELATYYCMAWEFYDNQILWFATKSSFGRKVAGYEFYRSPVLYVLKVMAIYSRFPSSLQIIILRFLHSPQNCKIKFHVNFLCHTVYMIINECRIMMCGCTKWLWYGGNMVLALCFKNNVTVHD